jgi:isocitrate/isopropylmalate dehydrogenase
VLIMENLLGDVLSDLGGATIGGISLCPSGNIGDGAAYFEPIHGSAPSIAGRGLANPVGQILAAAMMLDHLGHQRLAADVRAAVAAALAAGEARIGSDGSARGGPDAIVAAVVEHLPASS